ncbi:MAG: hypothetical protein MI723_02745, partial [Caulobacterales bacterium]|nr:hypothetical protein [Caulobacterales bacterium]
EEPIERAPRGADPLRMLAPSPAPKRARERRPAVDAPPARERRSASASTPNFGGIFDQSLEAPRERGAPRARASSRAAAVSDETMFDRVIARISIGAIIMVGLFMALSLIPMVLDRFGGAPPPAVP